MQFVECVTRGQPDKVADQIADGIVDEYLRRDKLARVSVDVLCSHGAMMIGGEVTSTADFDVGAIAKRVYRECGYLDEIEPFVNISTDVSEVIALDKLGSANDVTVASGYATSVTPQFLPKPYVLAQAVVKRLDDLRGLDPEFAWLRPDGKVLIGADRGSIKYATLIVQHDDSVDESLVRTRLFERVLLPVLGSAESVTIAINRQGKYTQGGFQLGVGVTGRKIASDTYGGLLPWGGGALSGKDPSKIDRLGSYMARFAAKTLCAKGLGRSIMVDVVYARGEERPIYLKARTGEGKDLTNQLASFDFRPSAILERLDLRRPIYRATACYGHFGREGFPWEKVEE